MKALLNSFELIIPTRMLRTGALVLIATLLMACQGETSAQTATVDESKYSPVSAPITVSTGDKIEVIELFWYGCNHCFALEPHIKAWQKNNMPANAEFKKVPAVFSTRWEFHAKAFYTMQALDVPEEAYDNLFRAIHVERKNINNLRALVSHLKPYGKDQEEVESAFNSFAVDSQFRNASKITRASGATGVPAMIVDGKYLTSQQKAGGTAELFQVVNQLVDKAASER